MRVQIVVGYDGTNYCGWQSQPNGVSVQQVLQDAIYDLANEKVTVTGSGRTDAGVHAEGQVAHFDLMKGRIPPHKIYLALNTVLPNDIRVFSSKKVDENFNARKSAKEKTYRYNFYISKVENPLLERFAERINDDVNIEKMKEVCKLFEGEHSFKGFCSNGSSAQTFERTIYNAKAVKKGKQVYLEFTGSGFLYNMVRILSGTVISFASGKITKEDIEYSLKTGEKIKNIKTMPAKALVLKSVKYK